MKVLSVQNPFSWLICLGLKDIENRSWKTNHRGRLYIHSSGKPKKNYHFDFDTLPFEIDDDYGKYKEGRGDLPYLKECEILDKAIEISKKENHIIFKSGYIIGFVDIVDCIEKTNSIWGNLDEYNWVLEKPKLLKNPVEVKGTLGIWNYDQVIDINTIKLDELIPEYKNELIKPEIKLDKEVKKSNVINKPVSVIDLKRVRYNLRIKKSGSIL